MKNLCALLLLAAFLLPKNSWGQSLAWQSLQAPPTTGQVRPAAIVADQVGNIYVAGAFEGTATFGAVVLNSAGSGDAFVAKYSLVTNAWAWAVAAGGPGDDAAAALALGQKGALYVGGRYGATASFGTFSFANTSGSDDAFVARLSDGGTGATFAWAVPLSSDFIDGVSGLAARAGSVYAAGTFYGSTLAAGGAVALPNAGGASGSSDGYLVKITDQGSSGLPRWGQALGGPDYDYLNAVLVRGSNVYVGGSFAGTAVVGGLVVLTTAGGAADDDVLLARFFDQTTSAALRWAVRGGGPGYDAATKLAANKTGLFAAGVFAGTATFGSTTLVGGPTTAFAVRLPRTATTGQYNWALAAGGTGTTAPTALALRGLNLYLGGSYTGTPAFDAAALPAAAGPAPFVAKLTDQTTSGQWRSALAATTALGSLDGLVGSPGRGFYAVGGAVAPATFGGFGLTAPTGPAVGYVAGIGDVFPMNVTALNPGRHAGAAPAGGGIQIQFDQPVNPSAGSVGGVEVYASESGGRRSGAATAGGNTLSFAPGAAFRPGERVQVSITDDVQSTSGAVAAAQVYQFRVAAGGTGQGRLRAAGGAAALALAPATLVLADLNADGNLDAVGGGTFSRNGLSVGLGDGRGGFAAGNRGVTGTANTGVAVADVDGDGDPDLLLASGTNGGSNLVRVRLNDGAANFSNAPDVPTSSQPTAVAVADLNADGDPDLLVATLRDAAFQSTGTVTVYLGDGSGTFAATPTEVPVDTNPFRLVVGDFNDDGRLDFVTANNSPGAGTLSLRLGDGLGGFAAPATGAELPVALMPQRLAAGDLNADGHLDLVSCASGANPVNVYLGDGTGHFAAAPDVVLPDLPFALDLADLNADGRLDLVSAGNAGVAVRLGDGTGGFALAAPGGPARSSALVVGDVDNDGDLDVVTTDFGTASVLQTLLNTPLVAPDLVVSTPGTTVAPDFYNNITVTGTGVGTLAADVSVDGTLLVQSGGVLDDGCHVVTGNGGFVLARGGTLRICAEAGILPAGQPAGAVQVRGARAYSPRARYEYTYPGAAGSPATGTGLPPQVLDLTVATGPAPLALSAPVGVRRVLTFATAGTLAGPGLALLSDPDSTALAANPGPGRYLAAATVQRAVSRGGYQGLGYRHYAAPVGGARARDLAVPGQYAPDASQGAAYNAAARPELTTPFPTLYTYDQRRLITSPATRLTAFDRGWAAVETLAQPLGQGQGFAVNLPAATVNFAGPLTRDDLPPLALGRTAGPTAPDGGWHLLGNPYPAPLDWSRVLPADRPGLDGALYVFAPSGPYTGQYRAYANGQGNPVLPLGQGFFVRVAAGQTSAALTFREAQRLTSFAPTAFRRGAADARPAIELALQGPAGPPDALTLYAQAGASAGFDGEFDAAKLANPSGLDLAAEAADGQPLSIQGLPAFDAATRVPLTLRVPGAGTYFMQVSALRHLPAGLAAYLVDGLTGTRRPLAALPATGYAFALNAAQAAAPVAGRFWLSFGAAAPLAAAPAPAETGLAVYPNPARGHATVLLPPGLGPAALTLHDALGRTLRTQPTSGPTATLDLRGLPAGVYALRVAGRALRLVVE